MFDGENEYHGGNRENLKSLGIVEQDKIDNLIFKYLEGL